jgi:integrase
MEGRIGPPRAERTRPLGTLWEHASKARSRQHSPKPGSTSTSGRFHDLRHTSITNDAAAGASPLALMTKAGHANMATTQHYIHLAGVVFRDEAEALEARLFGSPAQSLPESVTISGDSSESEAP